MIAPADSVGSSVIGPLLVSVALCSGPAAGVGGLVIGPAAGVVGSEVGVSDVVGLVCKDNTREAEAEPVVHTGQSEDVQVFAVKDAELQVRLDGEAEKQMMEFAGCPEDDEVDVDCESESDRVSVTESVSQNVDLYSL